MFWTCKKKVQRMQAYTIHIRIRSLTEDANYILDMQD